MFCCPVQEEESLGGNGAPVESQLEVQHFLNLLHLLKPLTSLGLLPTRDFTGRNGKTELICVPRALFLDWNCFHF